MTIAFYTLDGMKNSNQESENNTADSTFTKADINASTAESWGWKIFEKELASDWMKINTINIAAALTDEEAASFSKYTQGLTNSNLDCFFNLCAGQKPGEAVDEYRVFTFAMDEDVTCLSELPDAEKKRYCLELYTDILKIISNYRKSRLWTHAKKPLTCICENNIYLHKDKSKGYIEILPAINMAKMQEPEEDSDLYDAAYLYFSLKYPGNQPFDADNETDRLIERCFSPFKVRRPTLEELLSHLNGENEAEAEGNKEEKKTDDKKGATSAADTDTFENGNESKKTPDDKVVKKVSSLFTQFSERVEKIIYGDNNKDDSDTDDTLEK